MSGRDPVRLIISGSAEEIAEEETLMDGMQYDQHPIDERKKGDDNGKGGGLNWELIEALSAASSSVAAAGTGLVKIPRLVIDTNILLSNLLTLSHLAQMLQIALSFSITIPSAVLRELDAMKNFEDNSAQKAREAVRWIVEQLKLGNRVIQGQYKSREQGDGISNDDEILKDTLDLAQSGIPVVLLTNDKILLAKTLMHNIPTLSCQEDMNASELMAQLQPDHPALRMKFARNSHILSSSKTFDMNHKPYDWSATSVRRSQAVSFGESDFNGCESKSPFKDLLIGLAEFVSKALSLPIYLILLNSSLANGDQSLLFQKIPLMEKDDGRLRNPRRWTAAVCFQLVRWAWASVFEELFAAQPQISRWAGSARSSKWFKETRESISRLIRFFSSVRSLEETSATGFAHRLEELHRFIADGRILEEASTLKSQLPADGTWGAQEITRSEALNYLHNVQQRIDSMRPGG